MEKLSYDALIERRHLLEDAYKSNQFKKTIAHADEILNELGSAEVDEGYKEKLRPYIYWRKAMSYMGIAEDIINTKKDGEKEEEKKDALNKAIYSLYDYGDYGWEDWAIYMLMSAFEDLGEMTKARNIAIYLLGSDEPKIRNSAFGFYRRNTDLLFNKFFEVFKKAPAFYVQDDSWYQKWHDAYEWNGVGEYVEFSKKVAIGYKFTNAIPYQDRKYVYIGRNIEQIAGTYQFFDKERIVNWIFTLDQLPADMVFPLGRPQPGLYMTHPVKTDRYYPMKSAEETLFMEKVREFCWLVQCLGAIEVSFHSNKGLSVSQGMGESMNVNAEVGVRKVSIGGGYSNSMERDESFNSNQQVELVQHFSPKKQAYCPNDLIWLDSDPAWQMLLKQRLEGGILEYTYKISSSETCQISTSEMEEVKANFEYIMVKANGSYNSSTDNTFSRHEDTEWSLHVKFAPLEELAKQSSNHKTEALKFSDEEIEYFDMVKECLEDGEIGVRERKLLDKIRVKNGISEERAKELEATLSAPQLTDDEKEYLEAFKDACEDGKVSDKQRRLLEKLRVMYGISEERAMLLENI